MRLMCNTCAKRFEASSPRCQSDVRTHRHTHIRSWLISRTIMHCRLLVTIALCATLVKTTIQLSDIQNSQQALSDSAIQKPLGVLEADRLHYGQNGKPGEPADCCSSWCSGPHCFYTQCVESIHKFKSAESCGGSFSTCESSVACGGDFGFWCEGRVPQCDGGKHLFVRQPCCEGEFCGPSC
jgi:hypothetical protein